MYCPKCGQEQVSDEMKFCPRCGMQLGALPTLLAQNGGSTASTPTGTSGLKMALMKKRQMRRAAQLMFASGVLVPIAIGFGIIIESPIPMLLPVTVFMAGLALMLYFFIFGEDAKHAQQSPSPAQFGATQQGALPPSQATPASDFKRASPRTAEIVQPPSVTEHTTRLLSEDK